jgi:hypothetical protein
MVARLDATAPASFAFVRSVTGGAIRLVARTEADLARPIAVFRPRHVRAFDLEP